MSIEELRWKKFPVLDDGFVCLVDVMGDDAAVAQAARVSYGLGTKTVSDDRTLIRYLMRRWHTSPFEMAELKFMVRVPMDTWRQWIRHRTASINEYSTRYSEAIDSQQKTAPDAWRLQAKSNRQGSDGFVMEYPSDDPRSHGDTGYPPQTAGEWLSMKESNFQMAARHLYEERLTYGVAREQARKDLPLSTYTEAYWKIDLHNLLHFLRLRMDSHAQKEIRDYATVIGEKIVAPLFPIAWEAFCDYRLGAVNLTRLDTLMASWVAGAAPHNRDETFRQSCKNLPDLIANGWDQERCRERDECRDKLVRLGLLPEA